jgi:hypothetical protein
MKLGLLIAIACLFLVTGTLTPASAHTVQSAKKFRHWFLQAPHITVQLLSTSGRHSKNAYTGRALIYGVGFHAANSNGSCDGCGNTTSASTSTACIYIDCGSSMTTTTSSTTTTTSTTTTSPSCPSDCGGSTPVSTSNQPGPSTTCSSYSSCSGNAPAGPSNQPGPSTTCPSDCSGSAPAGPSYQPGPSTTCSSYSSCSGSAPAGPSNQSGPSTTCPSDCGSSAPAGPSYQPGPSTTCSSYSSCSGSAPAGPSNQSGPSYNDCGCNTVDLQSSAPISAYTPGINLSQVPVNAFGEFRVVVNVRPPVRHHYTAPTIWAVNTYNDQPSNYAPMCYCG